MLPDNIFPVSPCRRPESRKRVQPSQHGPDNRRSLPKRAARRHLLVSQPQSIRRFQKHSISPPRLHSRQPDRSVHRVLKDEKDDNDRDSQARVHCSRQNV